MASIYDQNQQQEQEALRLARAGQNDNVSGTAAILASLAQTSQADLASGTPAAGTNTTTPTANNKNVRTQIAQKYLESMQKSNPSAYQNRYIAQLEDILGQIQGRAPFAYSAEDDPLYGILADIYTRNGRQAMQDTLGEATALTGGYNNSYAQSAAQQSYNRYMDALSEKIPELEARAYQRYNDEGDRLLQNYQLLNQAENQEYGRWQDERNFAEQVRQFDQNYELTKSTDERDYAYKVAMAIMQKGMLPSAELLMQAGISEADAKMIAGIVEDAVMYGGGNGIGAANGGGRSGGSGGGSEKNDQNTEWGYDPVADYGYLLSGVAPSVATEGQFNKSDPMQQIYLGMTKKGSLPLGVGPSAQMERRYTGYVNNRLNNLASVGVLTKEAKENIEKQAKAAEAARALLKLGTPSSPLFPK